MVSDETFASPKSSTFAPSARLLECSQASDRGVQAPLGDVAQVDGIPRF
jgi:hypothetical protein